MAMREGHFGQVPMLRVSQVLVPGRRQTGWFIVMSVGIVVITLTDTIGGWGYNDNLLIVPILIGTITCIRREGVFGKLGFLKQVVVRVGGTVACFFYLAFDAINAVELLGDNWKPLLIGVGLTIFNLLDIAVQLVKKKVIAASNDNLLLESTRRGWSLHEEPLRPTPFERSYARKYGLVPEQVAVQFASEAIKRRQQR